MNQIREQFSNIYDQYIEKIYRFVYLKVNSQEIAEDLTSKVFLRGWEAYKSRSLPCRQAGQALNQNTEKNPNPQVPIKNPGAFLYQIARNTVIDYYREKGRTKVVSVDNSPQIADPSATLQDMAISSSDINVVKTAIQKLKKDYQDVIIWHYLEEIPIAKIAEMTDKPAGTVRVMLHRGLKELKEELRLLDVKES